MCGEAVQFSPDQLRLAEFDRIKDIHYRINEHPVSTLLNLASADILIASRSSYSYVAAVAGTVRCVVMPRFWHALKADWVESNPESGAFDAGKLAEILNRMRVAPSAGNGG